MSTLIQCRGVTHHAGTRRLFTGLDLTIGAGDKIGLVGYNGSGKSTLLSLVNGNQVPDDGDITRSGDLKLETVEQFIDDSLLGLTALGAVTAKLPQEERDFNQYRAVMLLERLGFAAAQHDFLVGDLSGGQQNRLMFARAMILEPNLVLFDEPTNHLDLRTLLYFEEFLRAMSAGYLLVSHDRQFLDAVTNRTLFLRDEKIHSFQLPFSAARKQLQAQDEAALARLGAEEKNINALKVSAKRLATWGKVYDNEKFAAKAKSMEKRIERLEEEKTFVTRGSDLSLTLDVQRSRANRILQVEDHLILAPDDSPLFFIEEFTIRPGDRIALLGHNGAGKTTFIRQLLAQYEANETRDEVRFNPQCEIGYYDQELERLDPDWNMLDTLRQTCPGTDPEYKAALIHAGFPYDTHDKQVGVMSGGERARLMFLVIRLNQPNLLILDEPTNHIDIEGKEELEEQIMTADATVLITSHDRRFVDNIAERYVLIQGGRLVEINDPALFYASGPDSTSNVAGQIEANDERAPLDDEAVLARIVELEELLAADLARKPRHQKPERQANWRKEIDALSKRL